MPEVKLTKVKALRGWSGGTYGSREQGEKFMYDVDHDPDGIKKLGFIEIVDEAASAEPAGGKDKK